jgi:hypothetical protein
LLPAYDSLEAVPLHRQELVSFVIEDDLARASSGGIEVRVMLAGGEERWCFFMTPPALAACGDLLPRSGLRIHLGVKHMIVVSEIDAEVVAEVFAQIDKEGLLREHTSSIV